MNGGIVSRRAGKTRFQQFAQQIWLGLCDAIHPRVYYRYELFLPQKRAHVGGFLQRFETKRALYIYMKEAIREPCTPANNKLHFEQHLVTHDLPTVLSVAAFAKGRRIDRDGPVLLPVGDLFVKPINGRGGEDCMRYRYVAGKWRAAGSDRQFSAEQLLDHIAQFSQRTPCLIQRRYHAHHDLRDLAGEALATIRGRLPHAAPP
ncbi:MAG: hypothetical protein ABWY00_13095 [Dongiaceae bacterium]